jgi:hypothetical protein
LPQKNDSFIGRQEILKTIEKQLTESKSTVVSQIVTGLGGVGKTQLALAYAHQATKYDVILWMRAEETLFIQFSNLAQDKDKGFGWDIKEFSEEQLIRKVYEHLLDKKVLLVFDNAEDSKQLKNFYPVGYKNIHVLITSRNNQYWDKVEPLKLDVFTEEEAYEYIQKYLPNEKKEDMLKLAKILGRLPLALSQAVAYIAERKTDITTYLEIYEKKQEKLLKESGFEKADGYEKTVYTTWDISMEALKDNQDAIETMRFCAYLSPDAIPNFLLKKWLKKDLDDVLDIRLALMRYSLIDIDSPETFRVHRLVQEVIRLQLSTGETSSIEQQKNIICFITKQFPAPEKIRDEYQI